MLTRATFTNLKALRAVSVPLRPFTVLVGPNGVGKTTVLDGIHYLLQLPRLMPPETYSNGRLGPVEDLFVGERAPRMMLSNGADHSFGVEIDVEGFPALGFLMRCGADYSPLGSRYRARGSRKAEPRTTPDGPRQARQTAAWTKAVDEAVPELGELSEEVNPNERGHAGEILRRLDERLYSSVTRLRFDPNQIARPSPAAKTSPQIADDGFGLPTLLNHLVGQRDGSMERLETAMARLVPGLKRIYVKDSQKIVSNEKRVLRVDNEILERNEKKEEGGFSFEIEFTSGRVPAAHVSEGTLLALAILTLVHSPNRPTLILLDDVDRALHPKAQMELIGLLSAITQQKPDLQIITTAHSDATVMACAPDQVVLLEPDDQGFAKIVPVIGDPRWMTPSQITAEWFDLKTTDLDDLMLRYALLAGDNRRSDAEESEVNDLASKLLEKGAKDLPPIRPRLT